MQHTIVTEEQELSLEPTQLSSGVPDIRKGVKIASDAASSSKTTSIPVLKGKGDNSVGVNARSGREYYDKWEKVAEDELLKLQSEDKTDSTTGAPSATPINSAGEAPSFSPKIIIVLQHSDCMMTGWMPDLLKAFPCYVSVLVSTLGSC